MRLVGRLPETEYGAVKFSRPFQVDCVPGFRYGDQARLWNALCHMSIYLDESVVFLANEKKGRRRQGGQVFMEVGLTSRTHPPQTVCQSAGSIPQSLFSQLSALCRRQIPPLAVPQRQ